ncbi:MAG TPA: response regulator transcription factor [Anaerolineales bacterium]|nr:response regulator transcription factor [Anaerolineales bacterium]
MNQTKTVLVVDDDPRYLRLVEVNLTTEGYAVETAMDGQQAVESVAAKQPDLILLDVMMPVMDGFTACARIREFSNVPIIILTAKGEERDRVRGLDAGADDYIVKPFSAQELLARVRAVLRRAERQAVETFHQPVFRHHELQIDLARAQVTCSGREISLTATEYRLLQTMAASLGRVLTPEELLSSVWGPEYRDDKEILWVCLSRLRQKIEPDPKEPIHIVTRQGLGYLMPPESEPESDPALRGA